jgi:hypothetical protein
MIASAHYLHLSPTAGKCGHIPDKSLENKSYKIIEVN